MKKLIRQYEINTTVKRVELPIGAIIRHVEVQRDFPQMWVEINPEAKKNEICTIYCFNNDDILPPVRLEYLGTVFQGPLNEFVWHIYKTESTPVLPPAPAPEFEPETPGTVQ